MKPLILLILLLYLLLASLITFSQKPELVVPIGHTDDIGSIAFSPNGRYILSGAGDRTLKLWEVGSGKLIRTFESHTSAVNSVAFAPGGKYILSGSSDKTLKLWDANTGRLIRTFEGHSSAVNSVAFSPNGKYALSGASDKTLKIWDITTGQIAQTLEGHADEVKSVAFSPNGKYIVSGSEKSYGSTDETINLWDVRTGRLIRTLKGHSDNVNSVAFSPNNRYLISGSEDKTIKLWDVNTGNLIRTFDENSDPVFLVTFSPDGSQVLSQADDGGPKLWQVTTGKLIQTFDTYYSSASAVAFSPDGKSIGTAIDDGIIFWEIGTNQVIKALGGSTNSVNAIAVSPENQLAMSDFSTFRIWSTTTNKPVQTCGDYEGGVVSIAFSPNGRQVLTANLLDSVKLWDANSGHLIRTFTGHFGNVRSIAFSPNGKHAVCGSDSTLALLDVNTGKQIRTFKGYIGYPPVAFSPGGKQVLSAAFIESKNITTLKLWDATTGKLIRTFDGDASSINSVAFSPNGKYILSGAYENTVKLWDASTGKLVHLLEGHTRGANSVAFSPNGKYALSGSGDRTLKLWDVSSGKLIRTLVGHTGIVKSVAFSPNGQFIFSGSSDHTTKIWNTETGKEIATLIAVDSTDWVVTTPTGLFDASPGAMELMHYVVNDSTDRDEPWKVIELEQLKQRYYQPGLLPILMGNSKETLRQVPAFEGVNLPPSLQLSIRGDKLTIKLKNRRGGIGPVSVFINGAEVVEDLRTNPVRDVNKNDLTLTLSLSRFANRFDTLNTVRVVALNGANWLRSRPVEITYQPAVRTRTRGGVAEKTASSPLRKTVRLRAVVVGTSNIGLRFAHTDAEQIANGLRMAANELLTPANVSVQLLITKPGAPPQQSTKADIVKALEAAKATRPEDIFVLHLAGHAINFGGQDGDLYYLTAGARSADASYLNEPGISQTYALSSKELTYYLNQIPARKKLLILDVCAAGKGAEKILMAARDVPASQIRALDRLQERTGFYVLAGSAADAVSYEASVYGQGLLTYALLKGLRGAALRLENSEEFVDVEKWLSYAVEQVPLLAKDIGGIQQPFYRGIGKHQRTFDIGRVTKEMKAKIRIAEPKPVLLVRSFQEDTQFNDVLDLENNVKGTLNDLIATRGADTPVLTMDAKDYPGAYTLSGRYTLRGEDVSVSCKVFQGSLPVGDFVVTGLKSKLPDLAQRVLTRAQERVKP